MLFNRKTPPIYSKDTVIKLAVIIAFDISFCRLFAVEIVLASLGHYECAGFMALRMKYRSGLMMLARSKIWVWPLVHFSW
jgi:hypothetical protein